MKLGGLGIKRKTINLFKKKYDQNKYWSGKGGKTHYDESIKQADTTTVILDKFLKEFLTKIDFKTVLDVACGYGKYAKLITDNHKVSDYCGVDISKDQIKKAKQYCKGNFTWINRSIENFKSNFTYDLVFGANILLHVKPDDIEKFINCIIGFSNKNVIIMDMGKSYQDKIRKVGHNDYTRCFAHDLYHLFERNPNVDYVRRFAPSPKTSFYYLKLGNEK